MNPFIDYYNSKNIIPVKQDLSDLKAFTDRRKFLYRSLGVVPDHLKGARAIEFGPGGGYNAVALASLNVKSIDFVDAATESINELKRKKISGDFGKVSVSIHKKNIYDFKTDLRYDIVIAEGLVPGQASPDVMLKHIAGFVRPGGILITTAQCATSMLAEVCRRVMRKKIYQMHNSEDQRLDEAKKVFQSHIDTLNTSTRPIEDWIQDQIFHDIHHSKWLFSIPDTMYALCDEFVFHGSLPRFFNDGRWYKAFDQRSDNTNQSLVDQYYSIAPCLLDYRLEIQGLQKYQSLGNRIEDIALTIYNQHSKILDDPDDYGVPDYLDQIKELYNYLPTEFDLVKQSISCYLECFPEYTSGSNVAFNFFKSWWGRGQQYICLLRK